MIHKIKLISIFIQTSIQSEWQYRLKSVVWVINGSVTPILLMSIWLVVSQASKLSLSSSQIITYYLLSIIMGRITQVWSLEDVGRDIRMGEFSFKMVKPYSYLLEEMGKSIGHKIIRLATLVPVMGFLFLILRSHIQIELSLSGVLFAVFAIILGFLLNFIWENFLATLVFYLHEHDSLQYLNFALYDFLSGRLIPLALLPLFVHQIVMFTPYRYFISFPIEIIQGQIPLSGILQGFLILTTFLIFISLFQQILLKNGIKKYSSFGH